MSVNSEQYIHDYANRMAPHSQRQTPVFAQVGKGLRGDSSVITLEQDGVNSKIVCEYNNEITHETTDSWELPLMSFVPKIHYEVWRGVREIDGELWWGYYIKFTCQIVIDDTTITLWQVNTPFAITSVFQGQNIPADYKIDSDEE